jgi:GNAT superfamily N-acetyltransferase
MSLQPLPASADSYFELYRGRTLLVALLGPHVLTESQVDQVMLDVADLVQNEINILLVSDCSSHVGNSARRVADRIAPEIDEIVLISNRGGITDRDGRLVPLLTQVSIERILRGEHKQVPPASDDVREELEQVISLLPQIGKVTMIGPGGLRDEILSWRGSGTMFVDTEQLTLAPLTEREYPIFREIYATYVAEGKFRDRLPTELEHAARCHRLLKAKNSPLAGFSLLEHEPPWMEFCVWWAEYRRDGFGRRVLDAAKQLARAADRRLYSLSLIPDAIETLEKNGFRNLGRLSVARRDATSSLPLSLRNYDTTQRDPIFLVLEGETRCKSS